MNQIKSLDAKENQLDLSTVNDYFRRNLPSLSRQLIAGTHRLEKYQSANPDFYQAEQDFWQHPDSPLHHEIKWHQWGILSHTAKFVEYLETKVPNYLQKWGLENSVNKHFQSMIGNKTKAELFHLACWMHDLGKFTARTTELDKNGRFDFSYKNHEKDSGEIVRSPRYSDLLQREFGLDKTQIEYVAKCAELHFVLGTMRNEAKKTPEGYTIAFANGQNFTDKAKNIINNYPEMAIEIGVSFLADTLAKHELHIEAETDEDASKQEDFVIKELARQNLYPKLAKGVLQLPANLAVVRRYLELCVGRK